MEFMSLLSKIYVIAAHKNDCKLPYIVIKLLISF